MISTVLEFPPKESCRILVSLLSLYGTCVCFSSVRAFITLRGRKGKEGGVGWKAGWSREGIKGGERMGERLWEETKG